MGDYRFWSTSFSRQGLKLVFGSCVRNLVLYFSLNKFLVLFPWTETVSGSCVGNLGDYRFWSTSFWHRCLGLKLVFGSRVRILVSYFGLNKFLVPLPGI